MDGFQPRIENPPGAVGGDRARDKYAPLRKFVMDAAGQWCLVGETNAVLRRDRNKLRAKFYHALQRCPGFQKTGIEIRAAVDNGIYKVYARYVAANAVPDKQ